MAPCKHMRVVCNAKTWDSICGDGVRVSKVHGWAMASVPAGKMMRCTCEMLWCAMVEIAEDGFLYPLHLCNQVPHFPANVAGGVDTSA